MVWVMDCAPVVFPACAGMFRLNSRFARSVPGFPRVRGDVPEVVLTMIRTALFSPRARGCSMYIALDDVAVRVFPACAGMFLN